MNKDRGTIKWTALMLPEHTARLRQWQAESEKVLPSGKTEWQLADIEQALHIAHTTKCLITLTLYEEQQWSTVTGYIRQIHKERHFLLLEHQQQLSRIAFSSIQQAAVDVYD